MSLLLCTVAILAATLYPTSKSLSIDIFEYDKIGHFLMFLIWTFFYGVYRAIKKDKKPNLLVLFLIGCFYGLLIELLQHFLPTNRSPELLDFVADALGSLVAIIVLHFSFKSMFPENNS